MRLLIFLLISFSVNTFAAVDSWYLQFIGSLSSTSSSYDKLEKVQERFKNNFDVKEDEDYGSLSGFSIYYTVNNSTLIGLTSYGRSGSLYGDLKTNGDDLRITYSYHLSGLSFIYYPYSEIGDGFFGRIDLGKALINTSSSSEDSFWGTVLDPDDTDDASYEFEDIGQGISLAVGRGWKVTEGSSFDLGIMLTYLKTSEGSMSLTSLTGAFNF